MHDERFTPEDEYQEYVEACREAYRATTPYLQAADLAARLYAEQARNGGEMIDWSEHDRLMHQATLTRQFCEYAEAIRDPRYRRRRQD